MKLETIVTREKIAAFVKQAEIKTLRAKKDMYLYIEDIYTKDREIFVTGSERERGFSSIYPYVARLHFFEDPGWCAPSVEFFRSGDDGLRASEYKVSRDELVDSIVAFEQELYAAVR